MNILKVSIVISFTMIISSFCYADTSTTMINDNNTSIGKTPMTSPQSNTDQSTTIVTHPEGQNKELQTTITQPGSTGSTTETTVPSESTINSSNTGH